MRYEGCAIAAGPAATIKSALDRWLLTHIRPYSLEEYGRIEYGESPIALTVVAAQYVSLTVNSRHSLSLLPGSYYMHRPTGIPTLLRATSLSMRLTETGQLLADEVFSLRCRAPCQVRPEPVARMYLPDTTRHGRAGSTGGPKSEFARGAEEVALNAAPQRAVLHV